MGKNFFPKKGRVGVGSREEGEVKGKGRREGNGKRRMEGKEEPKRREWEEGKETGGK